MASVEGDNGWLVWPTLPVLGRQQNFSTLVNAKLVGTETGVELRPSVNGIRWAVLLFYEEGLHLSNVSVHASASTLSVFGVDVEGFVPVLLQPRLLEPGRVFL